MAPEMALRRPGATAARASPALGDAHSAQQARAMGPQGAAAAAAAASASRSKIHVMREDRLPEIRQRIDRLVVTHGLQRRLARCERGRSGR